MGTFDAWAMVDSGAIGNFVSERFVRNNQIRKTKKAHPYCVGNVDGTLNKGNNGWVTHEASIWMKYEAFEGLIIWDITTIGSAAIILGMPWLQQANPSIDWETRTVRIGTNTVRLSDEISTLAQIGIPAEYAEYKEMFRERADHNALPEHQTWDHEIPIVPGKNPEKQLIYPISESKLEVLQKYIDENKAKGFIRESTSPVGYPILFVQKKDSTQRLCIDYRKLNAIIVKNSYPLPLIFKLQDCLQKAKWFTKLDSEFHKQEIDFLEYIIHPGELGMDPNKVTVIREWPEPKTVKEVQAFLGFANFYRRFIEKYSQKAAPLTNLMRKDQPF
ncbi:retrotransposon nucleocapsid protein [Lasallia pustulata]|uniref:Retrotransposon nucleocapsid protein n=1 Tax=Lasallia pustulata TaxID=136370 RepID=A0A1W5CYC2_9LECA|nr:retrotransposon nucleocapsid protein [Lasallia pustulata]